MSVEASVLKMPKIMKVLFESILQVTKPLPLDKVLQFFEDVEKKAAEHETKYKTKPIRRAFLIDTNANQYNENSDLTKFALDCLKVIFFYFANPNNDKRNTAALTRCFI